MAEVEVEVEEWVETLTEDGQQYWYNPATGESTWDDPTVDQWVQTETEAGETYWYNPATGESTWDDPTLPAEEGAKDLAPAETAGGEEEEEETTDAGTVVEHDEDEGSPDALDILAVPQFKVGPSIEDTYQGFQLLVHEEEQKREVTNRDLQLLGRLLARHYEMNACMYPKCSNIVNRRDGDYCAK